MKKRKTEIDFDIKEFREKLGFTQTQFALFMNVKRDTITCWECKKRKPGNTATRLLKIMKKTYDLGLFNAIFGEYV